MHLRKQAKHYWQHGFSTSQYIRLSEDEQGRAAHFGLHNSTHTQTSCFGTGQGEIDSTNFKKESDSLGDKRNCITT